MIELDLQLSKHFYSDLMDFKDNVSLQASPIVRKTIKLVLLIFKIAPRCSNDERSVHVFQPKASIISMGIMGPSGTPVTPVGLIFTTTSYDLAMSRLNVAPAG